MTTLGLETSTSHGSVALVAFGAPIFEERFVADRSHSASLFGTLEKARKKVSRIDQVAIGIGPGSYAGVRIAIAAALGLQIGAGAMLIGIPSIAALECDALEYLAVGDARRESFYFTHVKDGLCVEGPLLESEREVRQRLGAHFRLPVYAPVALEAFPTARVALPSALRLAQLASQGRGIVQENDLEPIYLREPHITQPKKR